MNVLQQDSGDVTTFESLTADLEKFKAEHANEVNPRLFHVFTISTEGQPFSWSGFFGKDLEGLGMAYCSKYKCWYWHNRLEKERHLDLRDARIIGTFIRKRDTFVDI